MSPEQHPNAQISARLPAAWPRACVLFEMLTGQRAFEDEDVSMTLSKVLQREPDFEKLPADVPARVRHTIRLCLRKSLRERVPDIGAVRLALEGAFDTAAPSVDRGAVVTRSLWRRALPVAAAFVLGGLLAVAAGALLIRPRATDARNLPTARFSVAPPEGVVALRAPGLALSPDGRYLAFVGRVGTGPSQLYVRALDAIDARLIPATNDASKPYWSPDSRSIGFVDVASRALKRVALDGTPPHTISALDEFEKYGEVSQVGGTWNRDDVILFGAGPALYRVAASGGTPAVVLGGNESLILYRHPQFLPDGRRFLVFQARETPSSQTGVYIGSLDAADTNLVLVTDYPARVSPPGYLWYVANGALHRERFDLDVLRRLGDAVVVAEQVRVERNSRYSYASFSVSDDGRLVFGSGSDLRQLTWVDRAGKELAVVGQADQYNAVELSRDGTRAALEIFDDDRRGDIWTLDLERGVRQPVTRTPGVWEFTPQWSPDDQYIAYAASRPAGVGYGRGSFSIRRARPDGFGADETIAELDAIYALSDWSPDGRTLFLNNEITARQLPLFDPRGPTPPSQARPNDRGFRLSPDGRFAAFVSRETGRDEVYVRSTSGGRRVLVSSSGGNLPKWRQDSRELYYRGPDNALFVVAVDPQRERFGSAQQLFRVRMIPTLSRSSYATLDGSRFLVMTRAGEEFSMTWVLNATDAASRTAP